MGECCGKARLVAAIDLQAHFSDIRAMIAGELDAAAESVVAAVAWLTDPVLLEAQVKAARCGCRVQLALLDDAINPPSGAKLEQVRAAGGAVFWIPEAERGAGSLHHKFCVIDGAAVITGSYNWTRRAGPVDENILVAVAWQDPALVERLLERGLLTAETGPKLRRQPGRCCAMGCQVPAAPPVVGSTLIPN